MSESPRIFIASSSEQIGVARQVAHALSRHGDWTVNVWDRLFDFSASYVESLERELDRADFAIVVLTGDDSAQVRHQATVLPRDNVIFELGLFIGRLGRARCFFFVDGASGTQIASDLSGVKAAAFFMHPGDAVGPPDPRKPGLAEQAERVAGQIREFGPRLIRYKPATADRQAQEAQWRLCTRLAGGWWERMKAGCAGLSALSYVTISVDTVTNTPHLRGKAYGRDGAPLADWKSVNSGIVLGGQPQVFYFWQGEFSDAIGQTYGGHALITFDDDKLRGANGYYFDMNYAHFKEGAPMLLERFRLTRCSRGDVATMRRPGSAEAQALVRRRLEAAAPE